MPSHRRRGSGSGVLLASAALPVLRHLLPTDFPRAHEIELTWTAIVFAATTAIAAALVAGLVPMGATAAVQSHNRVSSGPGCTTPAHVPRRRRSDLGGPVVRWNTLSASQLSRRSTLAITDFALQES